MGLFNRNPIDKKIEKVMGSRFLKDDFLEKLKSRGLGRKEGLDIIKQVKEDAENGVISLDAIEIRVDYLINKMAEMKINKNYNVNSSQSNSSNGNSNSNSDIDLNSAYSTVDDEDNVDTNAYNLLNDLVGNSTGFNSSFLEKLSEYGISLEEGREIFNQMKKSIDEGKIDSQTLEIRLNYLLDKFKKGSDEKQEEIDFKNQKEEAFNLLNELVGKIDDFVPSFNDKLVKNDISVDEGKEIFNELVNSINLGQISAETLEIRLNYLINNLIKEKKTDSEDSNNNANLKGDSEDSNNNVNLKDDSEDSNNNLKDDSGDSNNEELDKLKQVYNKRISKKYSPNFKFAYYLYLDKLNDNDLNEFYQYENKYNVTADDLFKQAKKDNFIQEGNPLNNADDLSIKDLNEILKRYDLNITGRKNELIERIGENLSADQLKEEFPNKIYGLSKEGLDFIQDNKYISIYANNSYLTNTISPNKFESLFDTETFKNSNKDKDTILDIIVSFLKEREDEFSSQSQWENYEIVIDSIIELLKLKDQNNEILDYYLISFILDINNFNPEIGISTPEDNPHIRFKTELNQLLNELALEFDQLQQHLNIAYNNVKIPDLYFSETETLIQLLENFNES